MTKITTILCSNIVQYYIFINFYVSQNKNILVTGVGKGWENMVESFVKSGAFVYGITRSRSDINKFKNLKNFKVYLGDVEI